ncbi:MAG: hypothetical protein JNM17_26940 [Archangium sp.]|nr:hypothetical protein [Archangium sp.]
MMGAVPEQPEAPVDVTTHGPSIATTRPSGSGDPIEQTGDVFKNVATHLNSGVPLMSSVVP